MKTLYTTSATTAGGRAGKATVNNDGLSLDLSVPKELGGEGGNGANPEQLFAMGYSSCYGSALQHVAAQKKVDLGDFTVTAEVSLGKNDEGDFQLAVILDTYIPGVSLEEGEELINEAHEVCPYSRATEDNIDVTLNLLIDE
ncbi:organic hydroperoxide resistance protein [Aquimarina agarivorans]|uniref:organic hydroperoxide resistance protein n=1 Tax=Aquimarina agarivorans TaxID=980584 RepID=UPI000248E836|nr:organic hydroperoxide resistance protein [Aquimarina agarivorans]